VFFIFHNIPDLLAELLVMPASIFDCKYGS